MEIKVYADGGSRGNPGPGAAGAKLEIPAASHRKQAGRRNSKSETDEIRLAIYLGDKLTNNQTEYLAVIGALQYIQKNLEADEVERVKFYLDSELIVRQLNGEYKVKSDNLRKLYDRVKTLEGQVGMVEYSHVGREENVEADGLVNLVLDLRGGLSVRG